MKKHLLAPITAFLLAIGGGFSLEASQDSVQPSQYLDQETGVVWFARPRIPQTNDGKFVAAIATGVLKIGTFVATSAAYYYLWKTPFVQNNKGKLLGGTAILLALAIFAGKP